MPIDYSRYPPDWKQTRARILERAGNQCEWCEAPNREWRVTNPHAAHGRDSDGNVVWGSDFYYPDKEGADDFAEWLGSRYETTPIPPPVRIVLTIAHLDHDEGNWDVTDDRLAALCQRCHLTYDAPEKRRRRREKKYRESLFPL